VNELTKANQEDDNQSEYKIQISTGKQLTLFEPAATYTTLDSQMWHGSFNGRESSLQQLSPYVGKMKTGMVKALIELYSHPGDVILDPFSGSGVVPLESLIANRRAVANDLSPYAYTLTRGKLETPSSQSQTLNTANEIITEAERLAPSIDVSIVPEWIREFYHPRTLPEIVAAFQVLKERQDYFITSCLLGIMHHVRPGFLSYPASHLVPYLRTAKFPPEQFPKMYEYRDLRSRLIAKIKRAYRRAMLPPNWDKREYQVLSVNSMDLPLAEGDIDAIISSPPYFGALDYARDNRLRLWFLGCDNWKELDKNLTANNKVYKTQMTVCLKEMHRVLKPGGYCVLVLGDVERDGKTHRTAEILSEIAAEVSEGGFVTQQIYDDIIPDDRRSRRQTKTTKFERILVMRKQ
jgi:SAM-dependent methyltransferase